MQIIKYKKEGNGRVAYGLKEPNDNIFTFWNDSNLLDDEDYMNFN